MSHAFHRQVLSGPLWARVIVLAAFVSLGLPAMLTGAPAATAPATDGDVLRNLRRAHPRLMVLDDDIAKVRELMRTDPYARKLRDALREAAEKMLDAPPVVHELVGPRLLGQSRLCLSRVSTLAGLYRLGGDRRFAERAEKEMLTAAAFPDWNPKHFLDTAEMTNALAIGYDWLFDVLSESSRSTIRKAIVEKGLEPGLAVYRKGGWWAASRHNWNQVCNGGMLAGALAIADEEPAVAVEIVSFARRSIPLAMETLSPDGGWPEGPGYWCYAMRYTAYFLAAANTALGTDFGLSAAKGFADTGLFRIHYIGPTGMAFNFADGGARVPDSAEMMYFARIFNRPVYAAHERALRDDGTIFDLLWYDPRGSAAELHALPRDALFRGIDVAFLRSGWNDPAAVFVGFKGGDNAANHSNLDLGTFVLDARGRRWAIELGPDDYNMPGYFGNKRWTYYRLKTEGQNTLVLHGANQNPKAKAPIVGFLSSPRRSHAVADLSEAYQPHARQVARGVALLDRRCVLLQDEIESVTAVDGLWGMHTTAQVRTHGREAVLTLDGEHLQAQILEPTDARWAVQEVTLDPPQRPLPDTRKLLIAFKTAAPLTRIVVLFSPGRTEPDSDPPRVEPLESWAGAVAGGG